MLVDFKDRSAGFGGQAVLHGVNLAIRAGERVAIMGRSGAGKTTLLNLIHESLSGSAALIPQAAALVRALSVFHNVYMGRLDRHPTWFNLRTLAWPRKNEVGEIAQVLEQVGLGDKLFEKAGTLSGGQQQRASVARALYNGRAIVIGDEPVSALDRLQGSEIVARLCRTHGTVVLALHDIPLALEHAGRIVVLDRGRIVLDAPSRELCAADLQPYYAA